MVRFIPLKIYQPNTSRAAGSTIRKLERNLSRMAQPCVRVAAIVVSEINERLSPKKAPPTTMAVIKGISIPVLSAMPATTGTNATIVPTDVPTDNEMKQAAKKIPANNKLLGSN